jgi:hypothetical protein
MKPARKRHAVQPTTSALPSHAAHPHARCCIDIDIMDHDARHQVCIEALSGCIRGVQYGVTPALLGAVDSGMFFY